MSSRTTMPVTDVRSESLPSIFGVFRPATPLSTTKPRIAPPCASDLAQMMNRSAIGAFEIQVLMPDRRYPSRVCTARVPIEPGSDPASGSVRQKAPINAPLARCGRYWRRCASVPKVWMGYITRLDCTDSIDR